MISPIYFFPIKVHGQVGDPSPYPTVAYLRVCAVRVLLFEKTFMTAFIFFLPTTVEKDQFLKKYNFKFYSFS